jgi:signal transduction histidine kinase
VGLLLLAVGLVASAELLCARATPADEARAVVASPATAAEAGPAVPRGVGARRVMALAAGAGLLLALGLSVRLLRSLDAEERQAGPSAGRAGDGLAARASLEQAQKLAAIGELAASVAHEVKNPMVGISGFAQLGRVAHSLSEAQYYFGLIEADTKRANDVLENLLDFSRTAGPGTAPLDPNAVVEGAVSLCRHHLGLLGVELETVFGEGVSAVVGNDTQLRQVVLNLVLNAAQAVAASPSKRVTVSTTAARDLVEVRVQDSGPGIAPEVMARLFEPFFTTRPRGEGTGLGLAVSRRIVEAHRGTLSVEPGVGEGARFIVRLPAAPERPTPG